jgi:hypothetical protein
MVGCGSLSTGDLETPSDMGNYASFLSIPFTTRSRMAYAQSREYRVPSHQALPTHAPYMLGKYHGSYGQDQLHPSFAASGCAAGTRHRRSGDSDCVCDGSALGAFGTDSGERAPLLRALVPYRWMERMTRYCLTPVSQRLRSRSRISRSAHRPDCMHKRCQIRKPLASPANRRG